MKTRVLAVFVIAALLVVPTSALAQSSDKYVVNKEWAQLPAGMTWDASTSFMAADGKGNVIVLVRKAPFFRMFNREGKFIKAWGDDPALFKDAHSIMFDKDGFLWATDAQGHVVYKFSPDGQKILLTIGKMGVAGDNTSHDTFNRPDHVAIAPNGDIYVSDGYVNARVVQFDKNGKFIKIIGGVKGPEPGQLQLPHGVVLDSKGRIIVSDSDNKRISLFDKDGKYLESWPFASRGGLLITKDDTIYVSDVEAGTVTILKEGKKIDSVGGLGRPHGITLDTDGTIYAADSANRVVMKISPKK